MSAVNVGVDALLQYPIDGLTVLARGIETPAQLRTIGVRLDCSCFNQIAA